MTLLAEPTRRFLRTSVHVFFRFRVVLEQGLNATSTCIRNAKAVAQYDVGVSSDQDKNDVGIEEESINPSELGIMQPQSVAIICGH